MADAVLRIKTIMDVGDAVSNVGTIQKALGKLKLPEKLGQNLNKNISEFYKEYEKYQKLAAGGIRTQSDFNQAEKSLNRMKSLYGSIGKDLQKTAKINIDDLIDLGGGDFKRIADEISKTIQQINKIKVDTKPIAEAKKQIESLTKSKNITGDDGILNRMLGHLETGDITKAKKELEDLKKYAEKVEPRKITNKEGKLVNAPGTFSDAAKYKQLTDAIAILEAEFGKADAKAAPLIQRLNELQKELGETKQSAGKDIMNTADDFNKTQKDIEKVTDSLKRMHQEEYSFKRQTQDIDRQIQSYFGLAQMIRKVGDIAKAAFNTVKELDAAMIETAVVTNFDVGDMWSMLPEYTAQANQLGSTIKDVYEAATLYFQQGLNKQQSLGLANETLKMARIGGLQAAEATNMMTAALRGFNMEINQTSAQRINDVYSELAAITAADTKEIGSAMERTASIANSANMEFETTSAFLSQMIETTREAPENLGTAMKTIIARFQEMKQDPTRLVDSEGVAMDANKIDTALKTIGVDLTNQKGEFRDLDDVFLEISEKWDSLTQGQQRYIATIAAGSRQQSRFIAMMQNHERVMELVEAANNSAGAGQKQFEKTLDGLSAKLNMLKNAWNQFTMGLMNDKLIKGGVDALTEAFTVINKLLDILGKIPPKPFEGITKSALTLATTLGMLTIGKKMTRGTVMGVAGWWKQEGGFTENFKQGYGSGDINKVGKETAKGFSTAFAQHFKQEGKSLIPNALVSSIKGVKGANEAYQQTFAGAYSKYSKGAFKAVDQKGFNAIAGELKQAWRSASQGLDASVLGQQDANEYINGYIRQMRSGKLSATQVAKRIKADTGVDISGEKVGQASQALNKTSNTVEKFGSKVANAGGAIQMFGMLLQSTPLAPFGTAISMVGMSFSMLGSNITVFSTVFKAQMASNANVAKAFGVALWSSFGPIAVAIAAIMALIGVYKLLDKAIVTDKERLESAKDAAASASEAFDMAKQETSELNDAISRVGENESAFDTLVAGTAEFNEQLVTSNELITELLGKYPMLSEYVTTDENGLMHISKEGIAALKDYQKEIEAHASAMNLIQSADFAAEENRQKAEELEKAKGFRESDKDYNKRIEEAKLLKERITAETEMARKNAIRTALNEKEIEHVEALSSMYSKLYEEKRSAAEVEVEALGKHDIRQKYADYHGYTYNKSTKKMTSSDGSEIDYDDEGIKDEVIEQTVLLNFEENAATLDGIITNLDSRFSNVFANSFKNSGHIISDLLSSNINIDTDLLEQILGDPSEIERFANKLNKDEVASILGISPDDINNLSTYQKQVADLLNENANNIAQAQYENYAKLSEMMAQTRLGSLTDANFQGNQNIIRQQIEKLSSQQANNLSSIGQILQEKVGTEAMSSFIDQASFIYLNRSKQTAEQLDGILEGVNWESSISRLDAYNKMLNSADENIQKLGKDMLSSADEANIVGEAFDEFLGGDWLTLSENADDLKNSLGEIDGLGILKAAESSKSLQTLLDSGRVSAGGLAMALQGVDSGKISQASTAVLELLSAITQTTDAALEAHQIIENFDAGIDYSESNDFMIEGAEKVQELMSDNKWGNQQLENYIKVAAGQDRWNQTLLQYHGDLKKTTQALDDYALAFKDGITPVYETLANGKGINGKSIAENIKNSKIDEELKKKFEQVKIFTDENGFIQFDFGELTTAEFQKYLEVAGDMGDQAAAIMMEHLVNYNETEGAKLEANNLKARLKDPDFQKSFMTEDGKLAIDNASLKTLESILSKENFQLLSEQLGFENIEELKNSAFKVIDYETGERLAGDKRLAKSYAKTYYEDEVTTKSGITSLKGLYNVKDLQTDMKLDLAKLAADVQAKGGDSTQAQGIMWETYNALRESGKPMVYNGQEVSNDLKTPEALAQSIESITEKAKWYDVGTAIAEGIIAYMNKDNNSEEDEQSNLSDTEDINLFKNIEWIKSLFSGGETETKKETDADTNKGTTSLTDTSTPTGFDGNDAKVEAAITKINSSFNNLLDGITPESINTQEKQDALNTLLKTTTTDKIDTLNQDLLNAFNTLGIDVGDAINEGMVVDSKGILKQTGKDAAAEVAEGAKEGDNELHTAGGHARGTQRNGREPTAKDSTGDSKDKTYTVKTEDKQVDKTKEKVTDLNNTVEKGGTYTLNVSGAGKIQKAAKAAKDLSSTKESKTISVKTGKADTSSVKAAKASIGNTTAKIKVGADTSKALTKVNTLVSSINKKKATVNVSTSVKGKNVDIYVTKHVNTVNSHTGGLIVPGGPIYRARGGIASNPMFKRKGTDTVPAMLTPGEYVHNRKAVDYFGIDFMRKINHQDLFGALKSFGSAASGRYGRLGPNGRGGLTLTGEEGFEIAWLPSESRSMILGAEGPQMINLPSDAVVYTHEQSEDILKKKQTIDAGSHSGMGGGGKSNKSKSKSKKKKKKKKGKKNKNKDKDKGTINNFSIEEVVRFNLEPQLSRLTEQIADRTKEIEKILTGIGKTYDDIVGSANKQVDALNQVKEKNKALYNSYANQLADFRSQKGSVSWTDDKGKSHDKTINIGDWVDANGVINQSKIAALGSRAEREATFNFLNNTVKGLVDGMANADKAMKDAQEQIDELGQKISEAFYQWKNELTEVYDLTQRINNEVSFTNRFTSQVELELSKLSSGFGETAKAIKNIRSVLTRNNATIKEQIENQQQMIAARQRELNAAISYEDEIAQRQKYEASNFGNNTTIKDKTVAWARDQETIAMKALNYVTDVFKDIDGSVKYNIDWAKFNADLDQSPINKETYDKVKTYLDDLNNAATEFNNAIKEQTDFIKQTYESLKEYQENIADFEDTLIKGVEEEIENETKNAKEISSSISDALKDLLDEVKRKLDERRKQEDNAKTERDISQKQQRLAALRADTAGGHQVEIAQLEKEIADAQQDYGRTLEDQLLDRLQQQADEASKQRERQIELAETSNEISAANNKELVDSWLREPEKYKEQIKAAWLEANGYDEKGEAGQYVLRNQFESDFAELVTAVEQTNFADHFNTLTADTNSLVVLLQELTNGQLGREDELSHKLDDVNALYDVTDRNTTSILTEIKKGNIADLRAKGVDAKTLKSMGYNASTLIKTGGYTADELQKAGFTAQEVFDAGITDVGTLKNAGYSAGEIKAAGANNIADFKDANFEAKDLIDLFGLKELVDADYGIKDLKDAGVSAKTLREEMGYGIDQLKGIYSLQELKPAYTASEFGAANISYADAKAAGYTRPELQYVPQYAAFVNNEIAAEAARAAAAAREAEYQRKIAAAASNGKTSAKELKEVEKVANAAGHGARTWMPALAATAGLTWKEILTAAKGTWSKDRLASSFSSNDFIKAYNSVYGSGQYKKHAGKGTPYSYKTGGLADYTGPAWLDGTPSKPELVLNAADTKNFLALKDVLSRAVHSSNSVSNSYGDATYEININVDHLNNDYDVDRVAERVKKIIVKDAGYRNVTQVRNFR